MPRVSKDHLDLFFDHGLEITSRTIYIGYGDSHDHDLDQRVAADVLKGLKVLVTASTEAPINIILNNQGGEVQHGMAIYDAIRNVPNHVSITVYGHCYSMGAWILQAADTRKMSANSVLMIHYGEGAYTTFEKEVDRRMFNILFERIREKNPDFTRKQLDKMLLRDYYMFPDEALKLGLIDEIVGE